MVPTFSQICKQKLQMWNFYLYICKKKFMDMVPTFSQIYKQKLQIWDENNLQTKKAPSIHWMGPCELHGAIHKQEQGSQ